MIPKFLKRCDKNFIEFFEWTTDYLAQHNKKLTVVNQRNVDFGDSKCSGWCDGDQIVIARKNPLFEQVYCHEFAHMMQAVEGSPFWKSDYKFWDALEKKNVKLKDWKNLMEVLLLEHDCEKRSLALSKKWSLFDNQQYAQQANLYLFYYHYIFLKRKWMDSTSIYHPILLQSMPKKLASSNKLNTINMELMDLFDQCLEKGGVFYLTSKKSNLQ